MIAMQYEITLPADYDMQIMATASARPVTCSTHTPGSE
jgi:hypothetical protein